MNPTVTIKPTVAGTGVRYVELQLGQTVATAGGEGGWVVVNRAKNVGLTAWEGYAPYQMSLGVMLDGFRDDVSQEPQLAALHTLMRTPAGPSRQPSPVSISGPVPMTSLKWVITSLEQDSMSVIRNDRGELVRSAVTINLMEYVEPDVLVRDIVVSPAERLNSSGPTEAAAASGRTVTIKVGDTLWGIAQRELGAGKRYTEIVALNGIRDPNRVAVGTVLKLP